MPYKDPEQRKVASREAGRRWRKNHPEQRKAIVRRWKDNHPEAYRAATKRQNERRRETHPDYIMFDSARRNAQRLGVPFSITREWVQERVDRGRCEVTNITFQSLPRGNPFCASLDQKRPQGGYTPENAQVVVCIYNLAKNKWSHEDVLTLAKALINESI
jgi:hypothetical protein